MSTGGGAGSNTVGPVSVQCRAGSLIPPEKGNSGSLVPGPARSRLARTLVGSRFEPVFRRILAHGECRRGQVDHFLEFQPEPLGHLDQRGKADIGLPTGFDLLVMFVFESGAGGALPYLLTQGCQWHH